MNLLRSALILVVVVATFGWWSFLSQSQPVITDLEEVLPPQSVDIAQVQTELAKVAGNKVLMAVFAKDGEQLEMAVDELLSQLEAINWALDQQGEASLRALADDLVALPQRFQLLSQADRTALAAEDLADLNNSLNQFLFGLPTDMRVVPFARDPYNLLSRSLTAWMPENGQVYFNGEYFEGEYIEPNNAEVGADEGAVNGNDSAAWQVAVLPLSSQTSPLSFDSLIRSRDQFVNLKSVLEAAYDVELVASGALFHIAQASADARREIGLFSALSIGGILVLFLLVFRGTRALGFVLGSVGFGCLGAIGITALWFGQLHAIALVFGCSLIGVGVDYAFHYLCMGDRDHLNSLRRASGLALLSTGTAYLCLLQSDIPVVTQVAVLSAAGLVSAWLFVVVVFPLVFHEAQPIHNVSMQKLAGLLSEARWARSTRAVLLCTSLGIVAGLVYLGVQLSFNQTVSSLYKADQTAVGNDQRVGALMSGFSPVRFFLVSGDSADEVLERMESLRPILTEMEAAAQISDYQLLTDLIPTQTQRQQHAEWVAGLYGEAGEVYKVVDLDEAAARALQADVMASRETPMSDADINRLGRQHFPHIWLGEHRGQYRATVVLMAPADTLAAELPELTSGIEYVDQTASWARSLTASTRQAFWYFGLVALVVGGLLIYTFRSMSSLSVLLMPGLAALLVLVLLTLFGQSISVFHIFGLYLIVGLGLDYGIFIYRDVGSSRACLTAVLLSAMTTALAFGVLSQSNTPMIAAFGMTVLCGTLLNLLLVPAVRVFRHRATSELSH